MGLEHAESLEFADVVNLDVTPADSHGVRVWDSP